MAEAIRAGIPVHTAGRWEVDVTAHYVNREGDIETDKAIELLAVVYGSDAGLARKRAETVAEALA